MALPFGITIMDEGKFFNGSNRIIHMSHLFSFVKLSYFSTDLISSSNFLKSFKLILPASSFLTTTFISADFLYNCSCPLKYDHCFDSKIFPDY